MERNVKILWSKISADTCDVLKERFYPLFDEARRERIDRCKSGQKRGELLTAGALLCEALKESGLQNCDIFYEKAGKPYIKDSDFHFNISHSGKLAAIAFSDRPLGFDIQKPVEAKDSLIKRVLTEEERKAVLAGDIEFNVIWSLKESFSKLSGEGIGTDFSKVTFEKTGEGCKVFYDGKQEGFSLQFPLFEDYSACVAMAEPFSVTELREVIF